jgi:hypothetical protein
MSTIPQSPSYVIGPGGQPTAVLLDWATWKSIIEQLETSEDNEILRAAMTDIQMLARHERPTGWKSWEEFEAELNAQEESLKHNPSR